MAKNTATVFIAFVTLCLETKTKVKLTFSSRRTPLIIPAEALVDTSHRQGRYIKKIKLSRVTAFLACVVADWWICLCLTVFVGGRLPYHNSRVVVLCTSTARGEVLRPNNVCYSNIRSPPVHQY
jgi:hypothetical protein